MGDEEEADDHRSHEVVASRFEEVCTPPRAVSDVIADEIRDDSWIPRVIFRYSRLDLAHQVCAYVGCLGVDSPSELGE